MDIVERLRDAADGQRFNPDLHYESASEIDRLREALKKIAKQDLQSIARNALKSGRHFPDWRDALQEIQRYDNQAIAIDALEPNTRAALKGDE